MSVDPDNEVVATVGSTGAFNAALAGLLSPGDGVLLIEPFYGYHRAALRMFELVPECVPLSEDAWRLTYDAMRGAVTAKTRAIVICTPGNPSGRRYDRHELAAVEMVAEEFDLVVITDEVYEHIYFGPEPHISPGSVGSLFDRTVAISSLSKTFSIPGWRLGYAVGPRRLLERVRLAADVLAVCAPTPLQEIATEALKYDEGYYQSLRGLYKGKLEILKSVRDL